MINKLDNNNTSCHDMIDKINEIIDFLNDTYLMEVKDGQLGTLTSITKLDNTWNMVGDCASVGSIGCPHCGAIYYTKMYSESTCVYYPPIWKNGVNVNPDCNTTTTHCKCLNCGKEFDI